MAKKTQEGKYPVTFPGGSPLYFNVKTDYEVDGNGNPVRGSSTHTIQYSPNGSNYVDAATTSDFKNIQLKKYSPEEIFSLGIAQYAQPDGSVLGPTAAKSLLTYDGQLNKASRNAVALASINDGLTVGQAQAVLGTKQTLPNTPASPDALSGIAPEAPKLPPPGNLGPLPEESQLADQQQQKIAPNGLRYPKLMGKEQDKIKFQAVAIKPRQSSSGSGLQFQFPSPEYDSSIDGAVVLAIQSGISDQNGVDWGPDTVNPLDAAVFSVSKDLVFGKDPGDVVKNTLNNIYEEAKQNQGRLQRYLAGQAAGLNNVLARTDNVVLNPNLELLFSGPQLRPFSFQFKMSARNSGEATEIKSIIKYFKYHMAVRKETGLFLRAPHVFTIRYLKGEDENHPGINLISPDSSTKACALTNCSVDYTPLGSYMTYKDGTMVSYTLSLQFQEITPIYDTDYKSDQSIGY